MNFGTPNVAPHVGRRKLLLASVAIGSLALDSSRADNGTEPYSTEIKARYISVSEFGAIGDGKKDDLPALIAANEHCLIHGRVLFLPTPPVAYRIANTWRIRSGSVVIGESARTIIQPDHFEGAAIEISSSAWSTQWTQIDNLNVKPSTKAVRLIGVRHLAASDGLRMHRVYVQNCDVGFDLVGTQFCSFNEISGSHCTVGLKVTQDRKNGGGSNITFSDSFFSYNEVGIFIRKTSPYPLQNILFSNPVVKGCRVCGVYAENIDNLIFEGFPPEEMCSGGASAQIDSAVVKQSILHSVGSQIVIRNLATGDKPYIAEQSSQITIDGGNGAMNTYCDATSFITFTGAPFSHDAGYSSYYTRAPYYIVGGRSSSFFVEPVQIENRALPNEIPGDVVRGCHNPERTSAIVRYVNDNECGSVMRAAFGGDSTKKLVINTNSSGIYPKGKRIVIAYLMRSTSSDAVWKFDWANTTSIATYALPKDGWYRGVQCASLLAEHDAELIITPGNNSATGGSLDICHIHAFEVEDARKLALFVREGFFNANTQPTKGLMSGDIGDRSVELNFFTSEEIQVFSSTITSHRTITLPEFDRLKVGCPVGAHYKIIRGREASGVFRLDVKWGRVVLRSLNAPGTVADFHWNTNSQEWHVTGYGTLG